MRKTSKNNIKKYVKYMENSTDFNGFCNVEVNIMNVLHDTVSTVSVSNILATFRNKKETNYDD